MSTKSGGLVGLLKNLIKPRNRFRAIVYLVLYLLSLAYLALPYVYNQTVAAPATSLQFIDLATFIVALPLIILAYMFQQDTLKETMTNLGLGIRSMSYSNIGMGVVLFVAMLIVEFVSFAILNLYGMTAGSTNIYIFMAHSPLWFLFFVAIIVPIVIEVFFRGFLVPRIGVILSAVLFAAIYLAFDSVPLIVYALVFGLLAGYIFKRADTLYPTIIASLLSCISFVVLLLTYHPIGFVSLL